MDAGTIIWITLAVLGAALIAGGVIAYRRSKAVLVRSLAGSAVAGGIVMWAVILFTIPIYRTETVSPEPIIVTNGVISTGDRLRGECFHTEALPLPLTYDVRNEPTPSGFDGRNNGGCTFSKPVSKVSVVLTNDDGSVHTETFFLEPPSMEISFPLPGGLASEKTLELLAPGEYQRQMKAIAEDGDEWDITANVQGALKTVTVVNTSGS